MKRHQTSNRYEEILREKGEKATKARVGLLVALERERFPISIKELGTKVKSPDPSTLYRSLKALAGKGLVREIMTDKKEARYEITIGRAHHHHVVCTSCGRMKDIQVCPEKTIAPATLGFSKITGHTLEFFGICKSCA